MEQYTGDHDISIGPIGFFQYRRYEDYFGDELYIDRYGSIEIINTVYSDCGLIRF